MCEVRPFRERKPGPLTPSMWALLTRMAATDAPAIDVWAGRPRREWGTTLDGVKINGATLNGLEIRGLAVLHCVGRGLWEYRLTDDARALAETLS